MWCPARWRCSSLAAPTGGWRRTGSQPAPHPCRRWNWARTTPSWPAWRGGAAWASCHARCSSSRPTPRCWPSTPSPPPRRLPIAQGPMPGADPRALAAAVSAAGGLGPLGCGMRSPAAMAEAAAEVRRRTDRPFGLNLFVQDTPAPDAATVEKAVARLAPLYAEFGLPPAVPARWCEDFAAQFDALVEARPAVASFTFGILNAAQVERLHSAGCTVIGTATTVAEAVAWSDVGADAVVASGMEAGGPPGRGGDRGRRDHGRARHRRGAGSGRRGGADGHGLPGLRRVGHRPGLP